MDDLFSTPDDVILPDEELVAFNRAPEKRLSTPITDGLLERFECMIKAVEPDVFSHPDFKLITDTSRKGKYTRYLGEDKLLTYGNFKHVALEFVSVIDKIGFFPHRLTAHLYPKLFRANSKSATAIRADTQFACKVYDKILIEYRAMISDVLKPLQVKTVIEKMRFTERISIKTMKLFSSADFWDDVVEKYRSTSHARHNRKYSIRNATFWFGRGFVVFKFEGKFRLATFEQILMIQDAALGRANVQLALDMRLTRCTDAIDSHVTDLFEWQDMCLTKYGNGGYDLIKSPEALFKAYLTKLTNGDILQYGSFERTVDKIKLKEDKHKNGTPMINRLVKLIMRVTDLNDCVELFGLCKLAGHPIVYARKSGLSVQAEGVTLDQSNILSIIRCERAVKHIILEAYITKNQVWPAFETPPDSSSTLGRHYRNRTTVLPLTSYSSEDLDVVRFGKMCTFDYSEDFLQFLDDKAICPGASKTPDFWFGKSDQNTRRLLLKALQTKEINMVELVERVRQGKTTREEEIVELTQKERELKEDARCFAKMTLEMRCYFALLEYNLGESIMKDYIPQQTMTMTERATKEKLYNMSSQARSTRRAILEIDFSRWNLRWRNLVVSRVGRIFEDMFGLPGAFSQVHKFFERCTVVVTDKNVLPLHADPKKHIHEWDPCSVLWRGHKGGFEGIQQKLWTVCTIGMIFNSLEGSNAGFMLAGQGDNQVLVLSYPNDEVALSSHIHRLLAKMQIECELLNQIVKPEECIDSLTVLTYSKDIYIKGKHYPYALKFLSRTMTASDMDLPSLTVDLSNVCATSVAAAQCLPYSLSGFFWQCLQLIRVLRTLRKNADLSVYPTVNKLLQNRKLLQFALLLPGSLGGLPIMSWCRYFIKGEVDELSWDLSASLRLSAHDTTIAKDLRLLLEEKYKPGNPDLSQLLADPHSIPIIRPSDAVRLVKDAVRSTLPSMTKNTWIKQILMSQVASQGKSLATQLTQTRPFYPTVMKDVFDYSQAGLQDKLYGRFTMTRTVSSAVGGLSFAHDIIRGNVRLMQSVINRYNNTLNYQSGAALDYRDCYSLCAKLRSQWGEGFEQSVIASYAPVSCTLTPNVSTTECVAAITKSSCVEINEDIGSYPPNFGTETKQKRTNHGVKTMTSSDSSQALKMITILASQLDADGPLFDLLDGIVKSRSNWSLSELLTVFPSVYGGVAAHRHDTLTKKHFGVLGSNTVPTHIAFSSDKSGQLAGGVDDYPFIFQEHYMFLTNQYQSISYALNDNTILAIGVVVPNMRALSPEKVKLPVYKPIEWKPHVGNKLSYVDHISVHQLSNTPSEAALSRLGRALPSRASVICSYLLDKTKIGTDSITKTWSGILAPQEMFDVAEIVNSTVNDILLGAAAFVALEAVYQQIHIGINQQYHTYDTMLHRIASIVAPPIARQLLNPISQADPLARELFISLSMGSHGAVALASRLSGKIAAQAKQLTYSDYILENMTHLVFTDSAQSGMKLLSRILTFSLTRWDSRADTGVRIQYNVWKHFQNLWNRPKTASEFAVSYQKSVVVYKSLLSLLATYDVNRERANNCQGQYSYWPPIRYAGKDADEYKRVLRTPKTVFAEVKTSSYHQSVKKSPANGKVSWESTALFSGESKPPLSTDRTDRERKMELLLSRLLRPLGTISTALSVWVHFVSSHSRYIKGKNILSVGIGHGSVAAACLDSGAHKIIGYDMRSSIPSIAHRETSFIPPEVLQQGRIDSFILSDEMFNSSGNWYEANQVEIISKYGCHTVIIDIESQDEEATAEHLLPYNSNCVVIARIHCSVDWIKFIISKYNPIHVYNLSVVRNSPKQTWIIVYDANLPLPQTGNFANVRIKDMRAYRPSIERNRDYTTQRLNYAAEFAAVEFKEGSTAEISQMAARLKRMGINIDDPELQTKYITLGGELTDAYEVIQLEETQVIDALLPQSAKSIRLASSILANTLRNPSLTISLYLEREENRQYA